MEPGIVRYELNDHGVSCHQAEVPNNRRGVPRVDDRLVLNGMLWSCDQVRAARSAGELGAGFDMLCSGGARRAIALVSC